MNDKPISTILEAVTCVWKRDCEGLQCLSNSSVPFHNKLARYGEDCMLCKKKKAKTRVVCPLVS